MMLDVVLYGYDRQGRLTLQERSFASHRELARFFGSEEAIPWDWAEVTTLDKDGRTKIVRYGAEHLRTPQKSAPWTWSRETTDHPKGSGGAEETGNQIRCLPLN